MSEYRVLARKYRPVDFKELIGQDAMVQTLSNAIETNRLAHAFILTGVRGVGKTTTARIIAKALNCSAHDGPTINPCGKCDQCVSISESRHVDVLEMDAASRTGVDDIREIIESVRYAPVSARLKIYIIDEVHMLSRNAFNALLKTLEEPPEHVKFIFATTEIRKLPVTVLSRCQRFDLKRVENDTMVAHLDRIVAKEGCNAEPAALTMIARAAEGSVRDSLSLMDQAIAHGAGTVTEDQVKDMLGLADRAQILDLFADVMAGRTGEALDRLRAQYDRGADPVVVINDLLEMTHWLTRLKVTPETGTDTLVSEAEKTQGLQMASTLSMPHLTRAWQMLLKGAQEVRLATSPIAAAEMVLIRLAYVADLPGPADLVRHLKANKPTGQAPTAGQAPAASPAGGAASSTQSTQSTQATQANQASHSVSNRVASGQATAQVIALDPKAGDDHPLHPIPVSWEKLVDLFRTEKEGSLAFALNDLVRLIDYKPGVIKLNIGPNAPQGLIMRVRDCLKKWTGNDWQIVHVNDTSGKSLRDKELAHKEALEAEALRDPIVVSLMEAFPEAMLLSVRDDKPDDILPEELLEQQAEVLAGLNENEGEPNDFDF